MAVSKYLLFLGCAIPYRASAYELSTRKVVGKLGLELVDMPEYNCCGLPIDPVNHEITLTLSARNLCVAEKQGLDIMALCPGCAGTLRKVNTMLKEDGKLREEINRYLKELGLEFEGTIDVKHLIQAFSEDVGLDTIKGVVQRPLNNLKVAEHNGCHVLRPVKYIGFDDPENPTKLKQLIEATGAQCLDYFDETECCGATIIGINEKIALQVAREKLSHIKEAGAQAIITACPFCHMMFDTNQPRIERMFSETFGLPVLHYPQLLGLAMGLNPEELGMRELRVDASKIMNL